MTFPRTSGKHSGSAPTSGYPKLKGSPTAAAPLAKTVTPVAAATVPDSVASGSSGLAYTGSSSYVLWLAFIGIGLFTAGEIGRRRARTRRALAFVPNEDARA